MDIVVQKNIQIIMRDGVTLASDVYRPLTDGPFPTVLIRTPYNKELAALLLLVAPDPLRLVQAGFAVVVQDCRGCGGSASTFIPFWQEAQDGSDTIAWITTQSWSQGSVGMAGGSYLGAVQWLATGEGPTALQALAPAMTSDEYYQPWTYQGGAFQLGFCLFWALGSFAVPEVQRRLANHQATLKELSMIMHTLAEIEKLYWHRPLTDIPMLQSIIPFYFDWLSHPGFDSYWQALTPRRTPHQLSIPALLIGGWYDIFLAGTVAQKCHSREPDARSSTRFLT
jgi:hypothetical protein